MIETKIIVDKKEWKDGCKWEPLLTASSKEEWLSPKWLFDLGFDWTTWDNYRSDELYFYIWRPEWNVHGSIRSPVISENTMEKLREYANVIFLCFWPDEGYTEGPIYDQINDAVKNLGISKYRCHLVVGNLYYNQIEDEDLIINAFDYWLLHIIHVAGKDTEYFSKKSVLTEERSKKLISLNRKEREHRFYILSYLFARGYNRDSYLSCLSTMKNFEYPEYGCEDKKVQDVFEQSWQPIELDRNLETSLGNVVYTEQEYIDNSYIHLVTETSFDKNVSGETLKRSNILFITEKTYKPILFKQIFLIVGNAGTLRYLHRLGIRTFPELFDESYDDEINPSKRMRIIEKNIDIVFNMSYDELHEWYLYYAPTIEANLNTIADPSFFRKHAKKQINQLKYNIINKLDG